MATYNRYKSFIGDDGTIKNVPFIPIAKRNSDKYTYWQSGVSRMDLLSYQYYNDPDYGWLILQANPELPSIEHLIESGEKIRIPYPLEVVIAQYENDIKVFKQIESE